MKTGSRVLLEGKLKQFIIYEGSKMITHHYDSGIDKNKLYTELLGGEISCYKVIAHGGRAFYMLTDTDKPINDVASHLMGIPVRGPVIKEA